MDGKMDGGRLTRLHREDQATLKKNTIVQSYFVEHTSIADQVLPEGRAFLLHPIAYGQQPH